MFVESNGAVHAVKGAETEFCQTLKNSTGPLYTIYEESNQSRCLTGSGGEVVITATCSGTNAEWHEYSSKTHSGWMLLQWEGNKNCAFQDGIQPTDVNLKACVDSAGTTADIWSK